MSLLIKGMEMPKSCDDCDFVQHGMTDWCYVTEKDLPCDCPLVPVQPHGRLIDAAWINEALIDTLEALKKNPKMDKEEMHLISAFHTLGVMVADAPTIIPAEEGE